MVGALLVRGMLVGLLAGLLAFAFAWLFGEPQINLAIAFEDHMHRMAGEPPDPVLVSRAVQSTLGLLTGIVVYGCALGGFLALVFAYAYGRLGRVSARATAALVAASGFVTLIVVPQIKYPANPPSIGDPATIGSRTALYFAMIGLSVIAAVAALVLGRRLIGRLGRWNAAVTGAAAYIAAIVVIVLVLPPVNEVPAGFSAVTLWRFRLASIGIETILWTTLGIAFGALAERQLSGRFRTSAGP